MSKPGEDDTSKTSTLENDHQISALTKSLARKETRVVNILRAIVLCVILGTAILVSTVVYVVTRDQEMEKFTINFEHSANQVIASFHTAVERNLASASALSNTITTYAKTSGQSFPFVTVPNFELAGADLRAQSGSHYLYWGPLVSDNDRDAWEEYALENRQQWTESYELDSRYRSEQDEEYGYSSPSLPVLPVPPVPNVTLLDDGTGYHPKVWSVGGNGQSPLGDEAPGSGPYLPLWQQSPNPGASHQWMNTNLAAVKFVGQGMIDAMAKAKKAIMYHSSEPLERYKPYFDTVLMGSQFRHDYEELRNDRHTMIAYPVFDSFDTNKELAGVLLTGIYWKVLFSNLLPSNLPPIVVVVENSFGDVFSYRIDGDKATSLGAGDHEELYQQYMDMGVSTDMISYLEERAGPETRSYKTRGLSDSTTQYTISVFPIDETAEAHLTNMPAVYTVVSLSVFLFASVLFLMYSVCVERRQRVMTEKVIENFNKAAETERELNEFLSHEIRNPLSAAISASTFISTAVNDEEPLKDEETRKDVRSDIEVVNSSLNFINDFLRSMLDIYRATGNKISVQMAHSDILQDILQPVGNILNKRLHSFDVLIDCPSNLVVKTDSIRLKQVILNLVRNATKFVEHGFVRMRAAIVDNQVRLYVEDSGPGISPEKQKELFSKYQESLDLLSQGTGIGLALSKKLMQIMDGDLWLDRAYDSGVEGSPGACFVVELKTSPVDIESALSEQSNGTRPGTRELELPNGISHPKCDAEQPMSTPSSTATTEATNSTRNLQLPTPVMVEEGIAVHNPAPQAGDVIAGNNPLSPNKIELPEDLSVLFVDDDAMLRKLFVRAVKRAAPKSWQIQEASSGEVALKLCEDQTFDLIFLDQYMASVDKQLLGTETAQAMRTAGIKSKICGLSANDLRDAFILAGADDFVLKPMPCKVDELKKVLGRVLFGR